MMDSLTQQQELFADLWDLSTYRLATFVFAKAINDSCVYVPIERLQCQRQLKHQLQLTLT